MKKLIILITAISPLILSCKKKANELKNEPVANTTPAVLDDKTEYDWSSISKGYREDIISKLYREALEKNKELKDLNDRIHLSSEMKNDSTKDYQKYAGINDNYWSFVGTYIYQIKDSTVKRTTKALFEKLELDYRKSIKVHEDELSEINRKANLLNDQAVLLKLITSAKMIKAYQENEKPSLEPLNAVTEEQKNLTTELKEWLK